MAAWPEHACYTFSFMRIFILMLALVLTLPASAQHQLFACVSNSKGYVVGAKLQPSGVFRKTDSGGWEHLGFNHPFTSALALSRVDGRTMYLAAGNGLIRLGIPGSQDRWKILTGSDVTELRDVTMDPHSAETIYFTHTRGIAVTHDSGAHWLSASGDLRHRYTESVRVDRDKSNVLLAATEAGLFRSEDAGTHWALAGAGGFETLRVEQSPSESCRWLATTELGGFFASSDCGKSFENVGGQVAVERSVYDLSWDTLHPHQVAAAGWGFGVAVSVDDGATWEFRNVGLPRQDVWSIAWDPDHAGRIYASVHEEGVYVSQDSGRSWKLDGLPGTAVSRFYFAASKGSR
jgi:hypothetical protein